MVIVGVTLAWEFYRLAEVKLTGDVPEMIVAAVLLSCFWSLGLVVVLGFQLNVATKRILRAIELASRSPE